MEFSEFLICVARFVDPDLGWDRWRVVQALELNFRVSFPSRFSRGGWILVFGRVLVFNGPDRCGSVLYSWNGENIQPRPFQKPEGLGTRLWGLKSDGVTAQVQLWQDSKVRNAREGR